MRIALTIFRKEAIDTLRDRRAIFFGMVLPVLLYPVLYFVFSSVFQNDGEAKPSPVGASGNRELFRLFRNLCRGELEVLRKDSEAIEELLRSGEIRLFLEFPEDGAEYPVRVRAHYLSSSAESQGALARLEAAVDEYEDALLRRRLEGRGLSLDPASVVSVQKEDISTPEQRGMAKTARLFPVFLVMLLLAGGSFVALDLVAGEKERGTLETLYVQPVPIASIVSGKFLVLLAAAFVAVLLNVAGLLASIRLGLALGVAPQWLEGAALPLPSAASIALIMILVLPLSVLTSAILLVISSRASSFREAQVYLLPVTLLLLSLVLVAIAPTARLSSILAVVPVANISLGIREVLEARCATVPLVVAFSSSCVYAGVVLAFAVRLLWREDVVLNLERPPLARDASVEGRANRGLAFGAFMLLFLYFGAGWLQSRQPIAGLALTLWVLVLVPALVYPLMVKAPFRETLGLRRTAPVNYLLILPLAAASVLVVGAAMEVQNVFLKTPREMEKLFEDLFLAADLPTLPALLLFAVSPAVCEELLWRGAFQGELQPRGRPVVTIALVGMFFGVFHQSIYRILPTGILGAILATVRLRTGSIFPCMLLHLLYNGIVFLSLDFRMEGQPIPDRLLGSPIVVGIAFLAVPLALWLLRLGGGRRKIGETGRIE